MKAVKNFKRLVDPAKGGAGPAMQSILGGDAQFVAPPMEMDESEDFPEVGLGQGHGSHALNTGVRRFLGRSPMSALRRDHSGPRPGASDSASMSSLPEHSPASSRLPSGVFEPERRESGSIRSGRSTGRADERSQSPKLPLSRASSATTKRSMEGTRGHARDPLEENWSYLSIGPSTYTGTSQEEKLTGSDPVPIFAEPDSAEDIDLPGDEPVIVSESPGAADFDIYETAYSKELERIRSETTALSAGAGAGTGEDEDAIPGPKVYLTRRVEGKDEVMKFVKDKTLNIQVGQRFSSPMRGPSTAFGAAVSMLRNQIQQQKEQTTREEQKQASQHNQDQAQVQAQRQERRGSHPYSSASIPEPEPSALEATGTHTDVPVTDSTAHLRRLLNRVRDKSGE